MRRISFLAPVLLLIACGHQQDDAPAAAETPPLVTTDLEGGTPPARASDVGAAAAIPARFVGVWDAETGTCDPASDLRLDIAPSAIGFYESHGTLTRIAESPDGAATVDLAMEGEGDAWEMTMTINLSGADAAERLVVQHKGEPGEPAPEPLRLKRCRG